MAPVLAATVTARWFATRRGLIMGILTASTATGTLIFIPALAAIAEHIGWQFVVLAVAAGAAIMIPFVLWLLPESPASMPISKNTSSKGAPKRSASSRSGQSSPTRCARTPRSRPITRRRSTS